jgi:glycosyltransferase involved in cell wall biosynthesis
MNKNPKVSIVLTSYNHEDFIRQSIESALNQTFSDFELIILDDHSSDYSWDIISEYKDTRIISVRNETNQRIGNIRKAIDCYSSGDFIAIHHSDDVWEPTKLEKQVKYLEDHPNVGAVFTLAKIIDENDQPITTNDHPYYDKFNQPNRSRFEWLRFFFYNGNVLCNPSGVRRKAYIKDIDRCNGFLQLPDLSLWVQLCFKYDIHILQEELTRFRVLSDKSNWSGDKPLNRIRIQFETLKILDHFKQISSKEALLEIFPMAEDYISDDYVDILFALGMVALETGKNEPTHLFGLNLLFDALNDPNRANELKKYQDFDQLAFFELSAKHDIFSVETLRNMYQELQEKDQEIHFYENSKSWRFTRPLREIMNFLKRK